MSLILSEMEDRVTINTGNILSLNNITKNPGQNPTEELVQAIQTTLEEWKAKPTKLEIGNDRHLYIRRGNDELMMKMTEQERKDIKIGIKLFIGTASEKSVHEAIDNVFTCLNIETIDNLIVCYNHAPSKSSTLNTDCLENIKDIWKLLESYVKSGKINQIGLSDIEESFFRTIYQEAEVKPTIIQINLATCCVVPQTLTDFCKENEIQLLTHSDPTEILPKTSLDKLFPGRSILSPWVLRFLVHIKCRGVLTIKGYLASISKDCVALNAE